MPTPTFAPINLNSGTPAAPAGKQNVVWQNDSASPANITAYNPDFTGDSGSGGNSGNVPAPVAGDAAANKFLKANGSWTALGSASGHPATDFDAAGSAATAQAAAIAVSDPVGAAAAAQSGAIAASCQRSSNLSDLANAATARTNLGLAPSATTDTTNANNVTSGKLAIANGGTNATTAAAALTALGAQAALGALLTWTPTVTATGSMTVSSLTVVYATYIRIGPLIWFAAYVSFTLGGSASNQINISPPATILTVGGNIPITASVNQGSWGGGFYGAAASAGSTLYITPNGGANFTLGGTTYVQIAGIYRAA